MNITVEQFAAAIPCNHFTASAWYEPFLASMDRWEINTPARIAGFLANVAQESSKLTAFEENLNYSVLGLVQTWPSRFAVNPKAREKVANELAWAIGRTTRQHCDKERLANLVYGGRYGNGVDNGDGWRYRGRGPIQITFHDNYEACGEALGLDLLAYPELLLDPVNGASSAGWYWATHGCNELMDEGDFRRACIAVNGGLIGYEDGNDTGVDDRVEHFRLVTDTLQERQDLFAQITDLVNATA